MSMGEDVGIFWRAALYMLIRINFVWTLINLLPVLPLDGGQLFRDVCVAVSPRRGLETAFWMSVLAGGLFGTWCLTHRWMYTGIMFVMLAAQSYLEIQQRRTWQ
jgi:Zn-dependent protease